MSSDEPIAWSLVTRILHWLIAIPILLDFFIEGGDLIHKVLGYTALFMVLLRFVWGFASKDEANFSAFPLNVRRKKSSYPGHNPLASWTYIFIWILVLALGITGFMMGLDRFWGEDWLESLHETISNLLLVLVAFHFIGLILDSWKYKRKTWLGMFTGRKS